MTLEDIKQIALAQGKETCFFYIQEHTKSEAVSVGSNGNILRWTNKGEPGQKWVLQPLSSSKTEGSNNDGRFNIITLQNGENMAVGSNGNILRWAPTGGKEQQFTFTNYDAAKQTYNIQEHTRNEFVSVGSDGNILRWKKTNENSQLFTLIAVDTQAYPDNTQINQILNGETVYNGEENIPAPPICNFRQDSPEETHHYVIEGVEIIPSVLVADSRCSDIINQITLHPYYFLVRKRYWKNVYDKILLPNMSEEIETTVSSGCTRTDLTQIDTHMGVVVGASVSGSGGSKKAQISGKLSTQYSWSKNELSKKEVSQQESVTKTETFKLSITQESRVIAWQAVDSYTLYDGARNEVNSWTMYDYVQKIVWQSASRE